ncbi:unnamed protein product [Allacma fusca]|uniref:Uncharacterized protein n=1 Tax=Allacma fusca TaxID=39272 RepID=A0A8J2PLW4_9HEXA|nr:unnamed protein product [Allacma fusca]
MSFLGNLFGGGSSDDCNTEKNCDCNKKLKEHLRKCAGLGERPPLMNCCDLKCSDPCKSLDLSGPPTCTGCSPAPKCCPIPPKPLVVFVPKCNVPPTATFKCPDSTCECPKPKPKCSKPAQPSKCCNMDKPKQCPPVVTSDGTCKPKTCPASPPPSGCGCDKNKSAPSDGESWCGGNENSCDPKPLKM